MPKPSAIHSRARLLRGIDGAAGRSLVWIQGSAGSGKTTLAVDYIRSRRRNPLWYRVDTRDADPAAFFFYLREAVSRISPRQRETLPLLTGEYFQGLPVFTRNFFEQCYLRLRVRPALVLDDFHDLPGDSVLLQVLPDALVAAPEGVAVLILSRLGPPPQFALQAARGQVVEIGGEDLNFRPAEARSLARLRCTSRISPAVLAVIQERTQGWAAGLQLTFARLHDGAVAGEIPAAARDKMFDYFATELLGRVTSDEREVLLKTCVLPQASSAQADALVHPGAGAMVADFAHRNLFTVRLEGKEPIYRYHPLFQAFLRSHLKQSVGDDAYRELCRRAAGLLVEAESAVQAGALLIEARDRVGLAGLVLTRAEPLVRSGRYATLAGWIAQLPPEMIEGEPWLAFWRAIAEFPLDPAESKARMLNVMRSFRSREDLTGLGLSFAAYCEMSFVDFASFRGFEATVAELVEPLTVQEEFPSREITLRVSGAMIVLLTWTRPWRELLEPWAERARALLRRTSDTRLRLQVTHHIVLYHLFCGEVARADETLAAAATQADSLKNDPLLAAIWSILLVVRGWYSDERARWKTVVKEAVAIVERAGLSRMVPYVLAPVHEALGDGDLEAARLYLSRIEAATPVVDTVGHVHNLFLRGWEALIAGEPARAIDYLVSSVNSAGRIGSPVSAGLSRALLAQALVEVGRSAEAEPHLDIVEDLAARMHSTPFGVYALLTRADIAARRGEKQEEARFLGEALRRMREADLVNFLGWCGDFMARVANRALAQGIEVEFVHALIRRRKLRAPTTAIGLESWPWSLRVRVLGRFSIQREDAPGIGAGAPRPLALLRALIALGGRNVEETRLGELLWPEAEGDQAYRSLKVNVQRLRRLLGEQCLTWSEGRLSLDSRLVWVDAWALERTLGSLEDALAARRHDKIAALSAQALSLNRGAFLKDDSDVWVLGARERLRERFLRVVGAASEALIACGRVGEARPCCEKALEIDPVAERFYQNLIRCYLELGEKADGLAVYRRCREALARELQIAPSKKTEALYAALLRA